MNRMTSHRVSLLQLLQWWAATTNQGNPPSATPPTPPTAPLWKVRRPQLLHNMCMMVHLDFCKWCESTIARPSNILLKYLYLLLDCAHHSSHFFSSHHSDVLCNPPFSVIKRPRPYISEVSKLTSPTSHIPSRCRHSHKLSLDIESFTLLHYATNRLILPYL